MCATTASGSPRGPSSSVRLAARGSSQPGTDQVSGGFGLIAMRQRVQRLAGQLEIESEAGAGTAVSANIPAIPLSADGDPAPRVDGKVRATVIP